MNKIVRAWSLVCMCLIAVSSENAFADTPLYVKTLPYTVAGNTYSDVWCSRYFSSYYGQNTTDCTYYNPEGTRLRSWQNPYVSDLVNFGYDGNAYLERFNSSGIYIGTTGTMTSQGYYSQYGTVWATQPVYLNGSDIIVRPADSVYNPPPIIPFLSFPLAGYTPYTAPVSSVFDHSGNAHYDNNGQVVAFTGEKGTQGPYLGSTCYSKADSSEFGSGFNYTGTSGTGGKHYLCYDGHPGIDYPIQANTPIYAPANGVAHVPLNFPGVSNAQNYNTIEIDHQNGYKTYYLHLNSQNIVENQQVVKGTTIIGYSGDTGSTGAYHLHFEAQKNGIPVDPYGWQGTELDPYQRATNEELWVPPPISVGANSVFTSVQSAYDTVTKSGQSLLLQEQVFSEDLVFSKNITVMLQGGYDSNYQINSGWTTIFGKLTIRSGTLIVNRVCIR